MRMAVHSAVVGRAAVDSIPIPAMKAWMALNLPSKGQADRTSKHE